MALYGDIELPGEPSLENVRRLDLLCLPQINRMVRVGVAIDLPYLADLGSQIAVEMADLARDIASYVPKEALDSFVAASAEPEDDETFNANSAVQIRGLLFEMLQVGKGKKLKRTSTGLVSTGKKTLEMVRADHPVVPKVLAYRERSKLKSAFCDSLPKFARLHPRAACCPVCELPHATDQWRVHGEIMTTRAETGRLSMKKPNCQQIPVRSELGQKIRAAFVAPPGKRLVLCDLSQIELRDTAHLANCRSMIKVYEDDGDIHLKTCRLAIGVPEDREPTVAERVSAKGCNFGIVNGVTEKGLYAALVVAFGSRGLAIPEWLTEGWCTWFIDQWLESYPEVREYFELQHYRARRYRFVWTATGRVRRVPEVLSCHAYKRSEGERQAQNMPITGIAADQLKLIMAELEENYDRMRANGIDTDAILPVHDEIISEVDEEWANTVAEVNRLVFENVMTDRDTGENLWRVPVKAEAAVSERWTKG